jgi:GTP pyrophosphokinase
MVTVVQLYPDRVGAHASDVVGPLAEGLPPAERELVARALEFAEPLYAGELLSTGEPVWPHALGIASSLAEIGLDAPGRAAGILFAAPKRLGATDRLREAFGPEVAGLAEGV